MSSKEVEERLVISQEKHKAWEIRFVECFDEMHNRIRGQLLTTMEVVFPEGTQLEAIKSRIRDIQNRVWNKIFDAHNRIFKRNFSVIEEKECEPNPDYVFYKKKVGKFFSELDRAINVNIGCLNDTIENLVSLAEKDLRREKSLKEVTKGITDEVYWNIRAWLEGTVNEVFEIK